MPSSSVLPGSDNCLFIPYDLHNRTTRAPRSPALHRGLACHMCRQRKLKCDAGKPHCSPCLRSGTASKCQYDDPQGLVRISQLEEENRVLRERLSTELTLHPVQPHILEYMIAIFRRIAVAQFALPKRSIPLLDSNPSGGALQEAACAAAWASTKNYECGMSESAFMKRAVLALACSDDHHSLQNVQAMVVCAVLDFASGRVLQGQLYLGGALRAARSLGSSGPWGYPEDNLMDERETWWMLWHAERAWAPIVGDLGGSEVVLGPFLLKDDCVYGDADYMTDSEEFRKCHAASLAARAWALVKDIAELWDWTATSTSSKVESTTAALESVLSLVTCPSTKLVTASALAVLHYAANCREPSLDAARRAVAALDGVDVESMNAVVGWWMIKVLDVLRRERVQSEAQAILQIAVKRAMTAWGYMAVMQSWVTDHALA